MLLLLDVPRAGSWRGVPCLLVESWGESRRVKHVVVHPRDGLPRDVTDHGRCVDRPLLAYSRELAKSLVACASSIQIGTGGRRHADLEDDARRHAENASLDWLSHWEWPEGIDLQQVMATIPLYQAERLRRRAARPDRPLEPLGRLAVPLLFWSQQSGMYGLSRLLEKGCELSETLSAMLGVPEAAASRLLATVSVAANACVAMDRGALRRLAMLHYLAPRSPLHAHDVHLGAAVRRFDRELDAFGGAPIWQWIQALRVRRYGLKGAVSRCIHFGGISDSTARRIRWWLRCLRKHFASAGLESRALDVALAGWISESDVVSASEQFAAAFDFPPLDLRGFRAPRVLDGECTIRSIRVRPLLSVDALIEEGEAMRHCVGRPDHQHLLLQGRSIYFALHELETDHRATLRISCDRSFFGCYELTGEGNQSLDSSRFSLVVPELRRMIPRHRAALGSVAYREARREFGVLPLPRQGSLSSQLRWAEKQAIKLRAAEFFAAVDRPSQRIRRPGSP